MTRSALDEAFSEVPRVDFLPAHQRRFAALDRPLPIGGGQTSSQPSTVRRMLELLEVRAGQRVLDVGAGSGWTTALLGHLVGPDGRVVGLELDPALARWGAENLGRRAMAWTSLEEAEPGVLGAPDRAPFDRILVSAAARDLPAALVDQLAVPGRMVVPVAGRLVVADRRPDGSTRVTRHGHYLFVPLR
jgi:protein-L-isoaspartate(D-aspartate) O-methyltransferase